MQETKQLTRNGDITIRMLYSVTSICAPTLNNLQIKYKLSDFIRTKTKEGCIYIDRSVWGSNCFYNGCSKYGNQEPWMN